MKIGLQKIKKAAAEILQNKKVITGVACLTAVTAFAGCLVPALLTSKLPINDWIKTTLIVGEFLGGAGLGALSFLGVPTIFVDWSENTMARAKAKGFDPQKNLRQFPTTAANFLRNNESAILITSLAAGFAGCMGSSTEGALLGVIISSNPIVIKTAICAVALPGSVILGSLAFMGTAETLYGCSRPPTASSTNLSNSSGPKA